MSIESNTSVPGYVGTKGEWYGFRQTSRTSFLPGGTSDGQALQIYQYNTTDYRLSTSAYIINTNTLDHNRIVSSTITATSTLIDLSGITSGFKNLVLKFNARLSAGTNRDFGIRFNGVSTGTAYNSLLIAYSNATGTGYKTTTTTLATTRALIAEGINASTVTNGSWSFGELVIHNYTSTSISKVITGSYGRYASTSTDYRLTPRVFGSYISLSAITSIQLVPENANAPFDIGSKFELYGMK